MWLPDYISVHARAHVHTHTDANAQTQLPALITYIGDWWPFFGVFDYAF